MKPPITTVTWQEVQQDVCSVNPKLAGFINKLNCKDMPLVLASYPFGSKMVKNGKFVLPQGDGQYFATNTPDELNQFEKLLNYASIPLCMWLNTSGEVFFKLDDKVIPLNVFFPGSICGLWESLDPPDCAFSIRPWSVSVGARSLFTLPKISDTSSLKRLEKKYGFHSIMPKTIFDQSNLFAKIYSKANVTDPWISKILFFTKDWVNQDKSKKEWLDFYYYLLKDEWEASLFWRNKTTFDLIGQMFSLAQHHRNLKPNPYLIDTVMHLISIAIGSSPGFEPVIHDETCGPTKFIQECIMKDYGLKTYIPTLMKPNYLGKNGVNQPIYYSMQIPTMLETSPLLRKPHSILDDLRMVKRLLASLRSTLEESKSPIFDLIKQIQFDFYHTEQDDHYQIMPTSMIPLEDDRLNQGSEGLVFCETASFFRGCVKITKIE